jgi:hypothetical protein
MLMINRRKKNKILKTILKFNILAIPLLLCSTSITALTSFVVLTNPKTPLKQLNATQVLHLYLEMPDKSLSPAIKPFDTQHGTALYQDFYQQLGYNQSGLKQYRNQQIFGDEEQPPEVVGNTQQAIKMIDNNINAVVYVTEDEYKNIARHTPVKLLYASAKIQPIQPPKATTKQSIQQIPTNLWQDMITHFDFTEDFDRTAVVDERNHLLQNKNNLQTMIQNSIPYLAYVNSQCRQLQLPRELALLPMVESEYNPFAYSPSGASGLWQIMPQTATLFDLNLSWWYDSRRDVLLSTHVALNYLKQLNHHYGNWYEALTAYNAGPTMTNTWLKRQAVINNNYWQIKFPAANKAYVVKLIAIASIIARSKQYKVHLPTLSTKPFFTTIALTSQLSLPTISQFSAVSTNLIKYLNPALLRNATSNRGRYTLLLPVYAVKQFIKNMNAHVGQPYRNWLYHQVHDNETLQHIATEYHTSVQQLENMNSITTNAIENGAGLIVPVTLGARFSPIIAK